MKIALLAHFSADLHIHPFDVALAIGLFSIAALSVLVWKLSK